MNIHSSSVPKLTRILVKQVALQLVLSEPLISWKSHQRCVAFISPGLIKGILVRQYERVFSVMAYAIPFL